MRLLDKMKQTKIFNKKNIFQKYLDIFLTKCSLASKENKEYKANLWAVFLFDISVFVVFMFFFSIYGKLIGNILDWNQYDYFIYFMSLLAIGKSLSFFILRFFARDLITGELNIYLTKPISSYFMLSLKRINGATVLTTPIVYFILLIGIIYGNYSNYFLSFILYIFGLIYYLVFYNFIKSTAFFVKNNDFLIETFNIKLNFSIEEYTPKLFEKSLFRFIAFLLPSAIYGFCLMELLKGRATDFLIYIPYIMISFFIMFFGIILLWHYGLKKYEAFG